MTQKEKQLLFKDLCARLPYGVYVRINEIHCLDKNEAITEGFVGGYCKPNMCQDYSLDEIYEFLDEDDDVKLYLRPMSSMTEKERNEITAFGIDEINESIVDFGEFICEGSPVQMSTVTNIIDYLNEHHFDYCGLIEKSLALVAPEGMYKTE